jgi:hypothetical protein
MANIDLDATYGFMDKRMARGWTATTSLAEQANYDSVADLRTRLTALNAGYFGGTPSLNSLLPATGTRLDIMTKNDLVYALRLASDSAGI